MVGIYPKYLLLFIVVGYLQYTSRVVEGVDRPECLTAYYITVDFAIFVGKVLKSIGCTSSDKHLIYTLSGHYSDLFGVSKGALILEAYPPADVANVNLKLYIKYEDCNDPSCVSTAMLDIEFQDYDECQSNPCRQKAPCIDRIVHFDCVCPPGYGGMICETKWDVYCEREEDKANKITWRSAPANSSVSAACPNGSTGNVRRFCDTEGNWMPPDLGGCIRNDIRGIKNELNDNAKDRSVIEPSLKRLQNITSPLHASLSAADLEMVSSILDDIIDATETSNDTVSDSIAEGFLQSASNSIDNNHKIVWSKIEAGDNHVPNLLKSVERFGKVYSARMLESDEVKSIVSPNIVLQAKKSKPKTTVFPEKTNGELASRVLESAGSVTVEKSTLENVYDDEQDLFFSAIFYNDIQTILPNVADKRDDLGNSSVNSKVLAITVLPPAPKKLHPPISITLPHTNKNYSDPRCAFWDFDAKSTGGWSTRGCYLAESSDDETRCLCDHMTNFAVLMSPGRAGDTDTEVLSIISLVGCSLSILGLVITMFVYFFLWKYLNRGRAVLLMNLCFALLVAYVVFLAGVTQTETKEVCTTVAVLLHYFYLAAFFFMLAEGIDIVVTVVYVFATKSRTWKLLLLGWGSPLVIVGVAMGATQLDGYGNEDYCWLSIENSLLWAFVGPVLLIIVANAIFTVLVLRALYSTSNVSNRSTREKAITGIRSICVLLPVLGLTWIFGVFSVNEDLVVFQYLFAICNSLQGLFIFVLYCATNKQVKDGFTSWRRGRLRKRGLSYATESSDLSNLKKSTKSVTKTSV